MNPSFLSELHEMHTNLLGYRQMVFYITFAIEDMFENNQLDQIQQILLSEDELLFHTPIAVAILSSTLRLKNTEARKLFRARVGKIIDPQILRGL
jgi:hypothetical protein